jgi:hypothetical protein
MAIICVSSEDIVNLLIPVLLIRGETLRESVMTGLLIQVKRRKSKGPVIEHEVDQETLRVLPHHFYKRHDGYTSLCHTGR